MLEAEVHAFIMMHALAPLLENAGAFTTCAVRESVPAMLASDIPVIA